MRNEIAIPVRRTCTLLNIGSTTLYDLLRKEKLKKIKIGRKTLVLVESIERFVSDLSGTPWTYSSSNDVPSSTAEQALTVEVVNHG